MEDGKNSPQDASAQTEAAKQQLQNDLTASIAASLATRKPLLTHLNADTTWLLSIPTPQEPNSPHAIVPVATETTTADGARKRKRESGPGETQCSHRSYFHVLIDPWLRGSQSDVTRLLSQQWHEEESAVQSVEEVLDVIAGIEELASQGRVARNRGRGKPQSRGRGRPRKSAESLHREEEDGEGEDAGREAPLDRRRLDLVVVSHEFTDHMHKATLLEVSPNVPVFATTRAAGTIKSWGYFDVVVEMPMFAGEKQSWKDASRSPLPDWLSVSRVVGSGDFLDYHSAVMLAFSSTTTHERGGGEEEEADAVIYTPHGIAPTSLTPLSMSHPRINTLALIHGLHDINIGSQLNLGAHNGLKVQRLTGAKYWVGTHDEVKRGKGLVAWVLKRKVISLEQALLEEVEANGGEVEGIGRKEVEEVRFVDLKNGESLLLE